MSDSEPDFDDPRFLIDAAPQPTELSYTERRKRKVIESELKGRNKSRKQMEEEKREEGLRSNLLEKAERDEEGRGGESKALKMMKAMGFKPGDSLGLGKQDENRRGGFAKASFAPAQSTSTTTSSFSKNLTPTTDAEPTLLPSSKPSNEPIKFEIRTGRTGLGVPQPRKPRIYPSFSSSSSTTPSRSHQIDSTPLPDLDQFLTHIRSSIDLKRAFGILKSCRRTLEELDRRQGIESNCMWLDPDEVSREEAKFRNKSLFERLDKELDGKEEGEEEREKRREKSELDYLRGRNETVVELDEEVEEREKREREEERVERREREGEEKREEEEWFAMDVSTRLALTLSYLRHHYHYCFWCGCQYNDTKDLEDNCPGTEEDDH